MKKISIRSVNWDKLFRLTLVFVLGVVAVLGVLYPGTEQALANNADLEELEIKIGECIELIELIKADEISTSSQGCLDYMLNLFALIEGQIDAIKAIRLYGEPGGQ